MTFEKVRIDNNYSTKNPTEIPPKNEIAIKDRDSNGRINSN
jgi:hypothetical protein